MLADAMIDKPKRMASRLGTFGEVLYAMSPKTMDIVLNTAYNLFPDSKAAKGDKKDGKPRAGRREEGRRGDVDGGGGDGVPDARRALLAPTSRAPQRSRRRVRRPSGCRPRSVAVDTTRKRPAASDPRARSAIAHTSAGAAGPRDQARSRPAPCSAARAWPLRAAQRPAARRRRPLRARSTLRRTLGGLRQAEAARREPGGSPARRRRRGQRCAPRRRREDAAPTRAAASAIGRLPSTVRMASPRPPRGRRAGRSRAPRRSCAPCRREPAASRSRSFPIARLERSVAVEVPLVARAAGPRGRASPEASKRHPAAGGHELGRDRQRRRRRPVGDDGDPERVVEERRPSAARCCLAGRRGRPARCRRRWPSRARSRSRAGCRPGRRRPARRLAARRSVLLYVSDALDARRQAGSRHQRRRRPCTRSRPRSCLSAPIATPRGRGRGRRRRVRSATVSSGRAD